MAGKRRRGEEGEPYKMARAAKKAVSWRRSLKEQIAFENRVYKREMDIIMAWLKANNLDYEMRLYTKAEYEKKEGRGAAHGASLILQGEGNAFITVLNTTEPLDYYEELNDAFLALLQGREVGFGRDAGYELLNHYTIGIYEVL